MALTDSLAHSLIALVVFVLLGWFGAFSCAELSTGVACADDPC
jgi:hypothetical protein